MKKGWIITGVVLAVVVGGVYVADKLYPGMAATTLPPIDKVVVKKGERTLSLLKAGTVFKTYRVSLGGEPFGHKEREGDSRTPEGNYFIDWRNPHSQFHLSMHISYPNTEDHTHAERGGYSPGGAIMIHGRPNWIGWIDFLFEGQDWTNGCIAVNNIEMEEIWNSVRNGTPIEIHP